MFKNIYFRLGLISTIVSISFLVVLPRIPLKANNSIVRIDSFIGGYQFEILGGRYAFDLTKFQTGLDLSGGVRIVYQADVEGIGEDKIDDAINTTVTTIGRRVALLGVSEPSITPVQEEGVHKIYVELPGIDDIDAAAELIGQTAQIIFRELKEDVEWDPESFEEVYYDVDQWQDLDITGADLLGADVFFGPTTNNAPEGIPQIQLKFSEAGLQKFSDAAKDNIGRPISIYVDDSPTPLSMSEVGPELAQQLVDDPVISGSFTLEEAQALTVQIRSGALPLKMEVIEQENTDASLGLESVRKSLFAGLLGIGFVLLFMIFMYLRLGLVAVASLVSYAAMVLAIFKLIPVILTMPGLTGFAFALAVAADSHILIFERIKDEVLWGKPKLLAITYGFERAWSSIKISNITLLITAGLFFYFGTGASKGFGTTLGIGLLVSFFSTNFVFKTFLEVFGLGNFKGMFKRERKPILNRWRKS